MFKLMKNNFNLQGIRYIRTFARNQAKDKNVDETNETNIELDKQNEEKKKEVENYISELWKKRDKKFYFGPYTFILPKENEEEEPNKQTNDAEKPVEHSDKKSK